MLDHHVAIHLYTMFDVQVCELLPKSNSHSWPATSTDEVSACQCALTTPAAMPIAAPCDMLIEEQSAHQHPTLESCQVVIGAVATTSLDCNLNQQAQVTGQSSSTWLIIALATTHVA